MAVKQILQFGDNILKRSSRRVEKVDEELLGLVEDLKDSLYNGTGIGLAAPQIGVLKKVIFIDLRDKTEPILLINPKIIKKIGKEDSVEGCLSYPGYEGIVVRPKKVIVAGKSLKWEDVEYTAEGLLAKAFCHEIDHLSGILYTDKAKKIYRIQEEE
ncbi:peptide deformylase [Clostridium carboxidivorans P7]|uniref:Peptide deformylase n=1 Tax=Clostridium carboxidivorans P7 TaxID=536227 RepID=C6PVB8_9CLOT|nr:peptide deformylase [Clostridium carboxidivorans]AKN30706.1 peptide deformylase [Clostridium carboxidivorans P7]EET86848.1 peptide deformylase [Clostridium carboxidivorans P7]EFG88593.1 peptide deformylase [Clostridium carboxidivorans P7]